MIKHIHVNDWKYLKFETIMAHKLNIYDSRPWQGYIAAEQCPTDKKWNRKWQTEDHMQMQKLQLQLTCTNYDHGKFFVSLTAVQRSGQSVRVNFYHGCAWPDLTHVAFPWPYSAHCLVNTNPGCAWSVTGQFLPWICLVGFDPCCFFAVALEPARCHSGPRWTSIRYTLARRPHRCHYPRPVNGLER